MSLVSKPQGRPTRPDGSPTGYAHAAGTSFSAPLISGLAALIFEAGAGHGPGGTRWVSSDVIYESIEQSAVEHDGVIHVPTAIQKALEATGQ
jgi:hypothetical protein